MCMISIYKDANPTALHLSKPPLRYEIVCGEEQGDEYINLACPDSTKIRVFWAIFGRTDSWTCRGKYPDERCGNRIQDTNLVKDICEGAQSCQIHASTNVFGDPCEHVDKFLQVSYRCV